MDITPTTTTTTTTTNRNKKSPDDDCETPTQIQLKNPFSTSNGVLKRHDHHNRHHHHHHNLSTVANPVIVNYKECLKNHAASLGGHALDGCGEFMPSPKFTPTDPTSLKCAACGCHRNFHRREPELEANFYTNSPTTHVIEYHPHHRHRPLPPPWGNRSPDSASPSPISSSYYPASAPHMLLALSTCLASPQENNNVASAGVGIGNPTRKRFRTKFSQDQKKKMYQFAERVEWKIQKRDEEMVRDFCNEVGLDKGVLKVWMHNNKNTFSRKDISGGTDHKNFNILDQIPNNIDNRNSKNGHNEDENKIHYQQSDSRGHEVANGSSSS